MSQFASDFGVVIVALVAGLAFVLPWLASRKRASDTVRRAAEEAQRVLRDAERDTQTQRKEITLSAKEEAHELVRAAEEDFRARQEKIASAERQVAEQTRALSAQLSAAERTGEQLRSREAAVGTQAAEVEAEKEHYTKLLAEQRRDLQRLAGMTTDEAKELLVRQLETEARRNAANLVKKLEHEARETAADKAKHIIAQAIQRSAPEHAIETTVSVVDLTSDDLKGRIIGREGRNIRALEVATGVELIVDDTPGAIILSSFDPYRRAVAKQAIEQLVADGRIHPARIEEVVDRVRAEVDEATLKEGESAAFELGLHDLHPELSRMMGRLKFKTSYGQNVLSHSKEVAYLAGIMARELGIDAEVSVRAAFLHDIGKAVDRELQGTHLEIGIDLLRQHGESAAVVDAMAAHHMDIDWPSLEAMLVQAADAISAARPGSPPGHPRIVREATGKARGHRRFVQGRFQGIRAAGRSRDSHHGGERPCLG